MINTILCSQVGITCIFASFLHYPLVCIVAGYKLLWVLFPIVWYYCAKKRNHGWWRLAKVERSVYWRGKLTSVHRIENISEGRFYYWTVLVGDIWEDARVNSENSPKFFEKTVRYRLKSKYKRKSYGKLHYALTISCKNLNSTNGFGDRAQNIDQKLLRKTPAILLVAILWKNGKR